MLVPKSENVQDELEAEAVKVCAKMEDDDSLEAILKDDDDKRCAKEETGIKRSAKKQKILAKMEDKKCQNNSFPHTNASAYTYMERCWLEAYRLTKCQSKYT